jgi:hypothetical protein
MDDIEEDQGEIKRANAGTNTNPLNNIALIDGKKKKKPHNITIKYGNEPKILKNMKYSDKQNYRRYKTKTEPKLHQSIKIDEEDDIIATIKKAFGIENKKNTNYYGPEDIKTSGAEYIPDPEPVEAEPIPYPRYIREQDPEIPAPETPARRTKRSDLQISAPTTPSTATELTGPLVKPKPLTPLEKVELLTAKLKSPGTAAKERLDTLSSLAAGVKPKPDLSQADEKKFQKHMEDKFEDLTDDEIIFFRENYKTTGYLPDAKSFGKTREDREKKQKQRDDISLEAFKAAKR